MKGCWHLASEQDLLLRIETHPGAFVVRGAILVRAWPPERVDEKVLAGKINAAFLLGRKRTHEQDIEFLVHELVEIAVRALSPGINDPFTAMTCIDNLGAALCELTGRSFPSPYHYDRDDHLRLITRSISFARVVDAAFNQIRQNGRRMAAVTIRLLETIALVIGFTRNERQRQALLRQAAMIERGSQDLPEEEDRRDAREHYLAIFQVIEEHFGLTGDAGRGG